MSEQQTSMAGSGQLYMQTNEARNAVIHYRRGPDGTLAEVDRVLTGGAGSGGYNPIVDRESTPNPFEGARSVILSADRRFLFATNAGDNSVSSFSVGDEGRLSLVDAKRTGNIVAGRSGSAKSLAYDASTGSLYVLHSLGPDHIRLMSVDAEGRLTARPERFTVNVEGKPNRVATMLTLSPEATFLVVGTTFDEPAQPNPDGSPILWVSRDGQPPHSVASNAPDPDGLVVFPVEEGGTLGAAIAQDGGGGSPWFTVFLNERPDRFIVGFAVADSLSLASLGGGRDRLDGAGRPTRHQRREAVGAVLAVDHARRPHGLRGQLRLQLRHQLPPRRQRPVGRAGSRLPEGAGQRRLPRAQRNGQQRAERQLAVAGRSLPLPDLRQRGATDRVRDPTRRFAAGGHQRADPVQQLPGARRLLVSGPAP
jgi:hypothetical protein